MTVKREGTNELSNNELANYIYALNILRDCSTQHPEDKTGYDFQATLHNDVLVGPREHGSNLFLPWHRAHCTTLSYVFTLLTLARFAIFCYQPYVTAVRPEPTEPLVAAWLTPEGGICLDYLRLRCNISLRVT